MNAGPLLSPIHSAVAQAKAKGKLAKPSACERCGTDGKIHGHHEDYSRPLAVMWLCPMCHVARHRELGAGIPGKPMGDDKYASNRTNLYLPENLVEIGKKHFANTRYKSLSGFVESALRREIRKQAAKIRKSGIKLPNSIFEKGGK